MKSYFNHRSGVFMVLLFILVAILMVVTAAHASSGEINFTEIDTYIADQMKKHALKGISLAITQGDQIVYLKGYGTSGNDNPMTPQTPMYIGSQSKSITGLAIAQLVQDGKMNLNDPVVAYIPWFRIADPEASQKITISTLLHHTSGLSEAGFTVALPEDASKEDAVHALETAQLTAPVGSKHQYFNPGYDLLAMVIEQVSRISYEQYIQENIFEPLEMSRSYTDPELASQKGLSQGYSRFFGFTVPARQPHRTYEVGAGYIISTAEDMAHYAIALNNEGVYQGRQVLSPAGMRQLFTPVQDYGMGWYIGQDHIWHGGANETFRTSMELYPSRRLGIVLLINQGYMLDHYISGPQILAGVQAIALGSIPPLVASGLSVQVIGFGLLALVLGLCILHFINFNHLRTWRSRSRNWSGFKLAWEVAISFIIPTLILIVVFTQIKGFLGTRFNWTYQMQTMARTLPDIIVLMIVGSVPDYTQGFIKLYWAIAYKNRK